MQTQRNVFLLIKNNEKMKEFFDIFEKDIMSEGFSKFELLMMGVIAPAIFVLVCIFASLLP